MDELWAGACTSGKFALTEDAEEEFSASSGSSQRGGGGGGTIGSSSISIGVSLLEALYAVAERERYSQGQHSPE